MLKQVITAVCVLIAAGMIGNMFLAELKKARLAGKPWHAPYQTLPGIVVILVIVLFPFLVWLLSR